MPAIWNVNSSYNTNNKKVSSKLTFEVGEKFNGKILEKGADNIVTVKLADGWQFSAKVEENSNINQEGSVQFEVSGFEEGKLQLKIIKGETSSQNLTEDNLKDIVSKEGFAKEDISLMESMVKHNIPLTKENIVFIKSLVQFNDKIKASSDESNEFIDKFLQGKGIEPSSESGQNIKIILKDFLEQYKTLSKKDILFFVENDIDLNKDNIQSFNKLFKGNETIKEYFKNIDAQLSNLNLNKDEPELNQVKINNNNESNSKEKLNSKDIKYDQNNAQNNAKNGSLASKAYSSNDISKGNVNILSALKSMAGEEANIIKEPIRDILIDRRNEFTLKQFKNINNRINNLTDDKIIKSVISDVGKENINNKDIFSKVISDLFETGVELTNEESAKLKDIINYKLEQVQNSESIKTDDKNNTKIIEEAKSNVTDKEQVKPSEKQSLSTTETDKVTPKLDTTNMDKLTQNKILSSIIDNLEKEKSITPQSLSKILSEVIGKEINLSDVEFEKLNEMIISSKDGLKESGNEELTATRPQQLTDEEVSKPQEEVIKGQKIINDEVKNKDNIPRQTIDVKEELNNINNNSTKIENEVIKSKLDLTSKEAIKLDIKENIATIKDLVKDIIRYSEIKGESAGKVMELIKSNMNDFKLLNSISNEYYYLDIPVSKNGNDYPCKLIIKDNRREGKKIDKTNVKMVLSVKTINLGSVDGYIGISNNKLDVDIKCDKDYIKIVDKSKQKLIEGLSSLGFKTNVSVTEKQEELGLTSCREFFNDKNSKAIDIRV